MYAATLFHTNKKKYDRNITTIGFDPEFIYVL